MLALTASRQARITVARCGVGQPILGGCLPPGLEPGVRFVLFVGRIEPRKNLTLLLEAFACISDPKARLVVVGHIERSGRPMLSRLAKETRAVHFERVDDKTLWALYRHAAALVFPSLGEGFGLPVLEALAARCSVIVARTAALPEVGGRLAIYFDPLALDAAQRLTECIAKALAGLLHVDEAALELHLKQFAWPGAAEALVRDRKPSAEPNIVARGECGCDKLSEVNVKNCSTWFTRRAPHCQISGAVLYLTRSRALPTTGQGQRRAARRARLSMIAPTRFTARSAKGATPWRRAAIGPHRPAFPRRWPHPPVGCQRSRGHDPAEGFARTMIVASSFPFASYVP